MSDTLEAGRELDALIAEKWFGWIWKLDEDVYNDGRRSGLYRVICDPALWGDDALLLGRANGDEPARIDRPYNGQRPLHYSTDIAAAELIIGRLTARGCRVGVSWRPDGECRAFVFQPGYTSLQADAPTAAHALCLVALLACDDSAALATVPAPAGEPTAERQS